MRKPFLWAAALATSTVLAAPAFAQSPIPNYQVTTGTSDARAEGPTVSQLTAVDDARIARIKAELRLTSDQEGYWGKLESALKDISKRRAENFVARWNEERTAREAARNNDSGDQRAIEPPTPMERMRIAAEGMTLQAADMKALADAAEPIYGKLDKGQRRTLEGALHEQLAQAPIVNEGRRRSTLW